MPEFSVVSVLDGDAVDVSPQRQWNSYTGTRVRPTGYDAPELDALGGQPAKNKLSRLIIGQLIDLRTAHSVDRGRLLCDVYFKGKNLADFFPEYQ
jgi:endonuclease YncB( thermonuclease family)